MSNQIKSRLRFVGDADEICKIHTELKNHRKIGSSVVSEPDRDLTIQTSLIAPHSIIALTALRHPGVDIEYEWADEELGRNCGRRSYSNGLCRETYTPDTDKEAMELAASVWGLNLTDEGYLLNRSETNYVRCNEAQFDLIEVLGVPALYSNTRLTDADIPKGLFCYQLREGKHSPFDGVAPEVIHDYGGSVVLSDPLDFGTDGFIPFVFDTEPVFLGKHMSFAGFLEAEARRKKRLLLLSDNEISRIIDALKNSPAADSLVAYLHAKLDGLREALSVIVQIEGGMVAAAYSDGDVNVEVFDLDTPECFDHGICVTGRLESELRERVSSPDWHTVY